jgi:hemerythrin-like domain-containing protein
MVRLAATPALSIIDRVRDHRVEASGEDDDVTNHQDDQGILGVIRNDHEHLERYLQELEVQAEATPQPVLDEFKDLLSRHAATELEVLYPLVRGFGGDAHDAVKQGRMDQQETAMSILRLERVPLGTAEFRQELAHLLFHVRNHIGQDQEEVLPIVRERFSAAELNRMRDRSEHARAYVPRRSHPRIPKSGMGAKVANRLMTATDRLLTRRQAS